MSETLRVAIAGCGMAGPALAAMLARAGHSVTIFERAPTPGPIGAGILMQPTGLSVLARLGVLEKARALGRRVSALDARTESGRNVWYLRYADDAEFDGGGMGIHRGALFTLLHECAIDAGTKVVEGTEIAGVEYRADGLAEVRDVRGTSHGPFDMVAITAGGRHRIAVPNAPAQTARQYGWGAWWASLPDEEGLFPDTLAQWYRGTRELLGILPTGKISSGQAVGLTSLFWSVRVDKAERERAEGTDALRERMVRLSPGARPLLEKLRDFSQLTLAVYGETRMERWSAGRVVWLGDAAHAMSPHLGQGTNLALLDAQSLSDAMRGEAHFSRAFAAYEKERRPHTEAYQFISRWMMPFFQCVVPLPGWLRNIGMPVLCAIPPVRRQMLHVLAGIRGGLLGGRLQAGVARHWREAKLFGA